MLVWNSGRTPSTKTLDADHFLGVIEDARFKRKEALQDLAAAVTKN